MLTCAATAAVALAVAPELSEAHRPESSLTVPDRPQVSFVHFDYDRYASPGRLVDIGAGRRLNLRCEGQGAPTILLEAGLGWPSLSWRAVQPALAGIVRTCSYDRAGLGFSDPGPMPRSAAAIADDLERLVDAANLKSPFLLIGNSMGSQPVRLFAFRRPEQISGLIFLDPYIEGQYPAFARIEPSIASELRQVARDEAACARDLGNGRLTTIEAERRDCIAAADPSFSPALQALLRRQRMSPAGFEANHSESLMLDTRNELELARARRPLGDIPVLVLSASRNFASPRFDSTRAALLAEQARLHASLAALSSRGEVRIVDAGHVIQTSDPDIVVAAVRDILGKTNR